MRGSRVRGELRRIAVTALAGVTVMMGVPVGSSLAAPVLGGTITGTAYQDFNANGQIDLAGDATHPAVDQPVAGVTVTATCLSNTGADGLAGTADDTYSAPVAAGPTGADGL